MSVPKVAVELTDEELKKFARLIEAGYTVSKHMQGKRPMWTVTKPKAGGRTRIRRE